MPKYQASAFPHDDHEFLEICATKRTKNNKTQYQINWANTWVGLHRLDEETLKVAKVLAMREFGDDDPSLWVRRPLPAGHELFEVDIPTKIRKGRNGIEVEVRWKKQWVPGSYLGDPEFKPGKKTLGIFCIVL